MTQPESVVVTGSATDITSTTATLQGAVGTILTGSQCWFDYGPTEAYGSRTSRFVPYGEQPFTSPTVPVSQQVSSLTPGTTYHFRLSCEGTPAPARVVTPCSSPRRPTRLWSAAALQPR